MVGKTGSFAINFDISSPEKTPLLTLSSASIYKVLVVDDFAISKISNQVYVSGRGNGILHSINKDDGSILQSINVLMDVDNHDHGGHSHGAMLGGIAVH